jgi:hypothetical protein
MFIDSENNSKQKVKKYGYQTKDGPKVKTIRSPQKERHQAHR